MQGRPSSRLKKAVRPGCKPLTPLIPSCRIPLFSHTPRHLRPARTAPRASERMCSPHRAGAQCPPPRNRRPLGRCSAVQARSLWVLVARDSCLGLNAELPCDASERRGGSLLAKIAGRRHSTLRNPGIPEQGGQKAAHAGHCSHGRHSAGSAVRSPRHSTSYRSHRPWLA